MSVELILAITGIVAAVAVPVWQLRYGEQGKRSLPKKIEVTYFVLKALVAAQKSSLTANTGLMDEQLRMEIIEDCNSYTSDGNFDPNRKNKALHSYINSSIKKLADGKSETLGPLIETQDSAHKVTELGLKIFDKLQSDPSAAGASLSEYLSGSRDVHSTSSSGVADQVTTVRTSGRPATFQEWRHDVFMAMPDGEAFELNALQERIVQELSVRRSNYDKIKQAIDWNLYQGNLKREDDGRIRLATPKSSRTLDHFKNIEQ